jgi:hypothetical protein
VGIGKASASESLWKCRNQFSRHQNWGEYEVPG